MCKYLPLILLSIFCNIHLRAQQLHYTVAPQPWAYDSLGNHRVLVKVPASGAVAKVTIPWRRRDYHPENKQVFVVDVLTGKRILNVKPLTVTRDSGSFYFEPVSGSGTYYFYYMPYRQKGSPYYPTAVYYKDSLIAAAEWLARIGTAKTVKAAATELQSVNDFNSFYPMEIIATQKETATLLNRYKQQEYLVFPEDRLHSIRMRYDLPQRWIPNGVRNSFSGTALRGEDFSFQLGIYPVSKALKDVRIKASGLRSATGSVISAEAVTCINTTGVNWIGQPESFTVNIPPKQVQPLWINIALPQDARPGKYTGILTVTAANATPTKIALNLTVQNKTAIHRGADEPWKQTRLSWLNSRLAGENAVIAPYTPLEVSGDTLSLLGRKLILDASGLPAQIQSYFTPEMTGIGNSAHNLVTAPLHFHFLTSGGKDIQLAQQGLHFTRQQAGTVEWQASNLSPELKMDITGKLEFDGFVEYTVRLQALQNITFKNIQLHIPFVRERARYFMGLGLKGGLRPDTVSWKWDVAHKNQDGAWLGDVNAGLQFSFRDQHYSRPLNTNFYLQKPLILPQSWGNEGKGGINLEQQDSSVLADIYSGERTMQAGDTLLYNFRLLITPFHALDTDFQWASRFLHKYVDADMAKSWGATVVNIHQGTPINPYINYPFVKTKEMKAYIDSAHADGLKVKIYNTVRELSNRAYELPALFSLGHEIFSDGKSGGYSWLQEHLDTGYIAAWYTPEANDAAIINSGMSRWHNYYVEGMNWLTQNIGIDGIYLDDVAFDRDIMKRIKRVLTQDGHPGIIDLHSANQFNKNDGFNNSAMLYMELFPYLNRLWFGEYFDYENNGPDFFLTEVSGIPFGLMGEMLQDGGNPWRGMLYGMTNRLLWGEHTDPRPIWKVWDTFGMQGSQMLGYWLQNNPVKSDNAQVPVTVYKKEKKALVSLASWAKDSADIHLDIDWKALGIHPANATITAPAIPGFQPAAQFQPGDAIPVAPGKGWLLVVEEK